MICHIIIQFGHGQTNWDWAIGLRAIFTSPISQDDLLALIFLFLVTLVVFYVLIRHVFYKMIILKNEMKREDGFVSTRRDLKEFIDKTGVALTVLRPGGTIEINDQRLDARADGEFIQKGEKIIVLHVDGAQLVVDQAPEEQSQDN